MADVASYVADFDCFCREGLERTLRPYQLAPARAIIVSTVARRGHTFAILMARQAGKNELLACLAAWMLLRLPGIKIGIYAPTLPQAADISLRRIKRHLKRLAFRLERRDPPAAALPLPLGLLPSPRPLLSRRNFLELPFPEEASGPFAARGEGSLLGAYSAEKGAEKEGFTWDLILYDEAQQLDREVIDEEISPTGAATGATEVYIGTPYSVACKFYDVIQALKEGRLSGECFEYSYEAVIPHVPEYARFVDKKAAELGRDSIAFRTQYALEWVKGVGLFFEFDVFQTLALPTVEFLSCGGAPGETGGSYAVGIDLAGDDPRHTGRTDYTAIAVVRCAGARKTLVDLHAWQGKDWERQFEAILRILRGLPGRVQAVVDATGMGDPFSDRLQKALQGSPIAVERLKLTGPEKSAVGLYAEQEIAGGRVAYAAGPRTRSEGLLDSFLHQVRWLAREPLQNKGVRWQVPVEKGHDDLVCAFFLALWASPRSAVRRAPLGELILVSDTAYG